MISSSEINNHQICLINNNKIQYLHANRQADTNKQTGSNFTKKNIQKFHAIPISFVTLRG